MHYPDRSHQVTESAGLWFETRTSQLSPKEIVINLKTNKKLTGNQRARDPEAAENPK
jgi:hypothetical protein